ncbi:Ser-Thr-rich glycosyl-phosphatidyl-inositol-anchored membrane family-domain-containing protein [Aspergillus oleicola]
MRSMLFVALSAIATLVAARENPFNIPRDGYSFTAGESTTLNWDPTTEGTVTLKLQWGSSAFTSSSGTTIASNIANSGSYTWSVPSDITEHSDYTVEIISDSDSDATNYLPRFSVEGAEAATTTTATSTTTTETTTTEETTTTTETSSTTTRTTMTTTTDSSETPSPTPTDSTSSGTPAANTTTDSSSTSTESSESPSDSPTSVPTVNDDEDGDNAGMSNRVSGGLLALALGVAALV